MSTLKLKVSKVSNVNPKTKQKGFTARVLTNGTADTDDIVKEAGHNTTMHKAEVRMALELCLEAAAEMLKQGYIVELGPIGKIYPSCSSGWVEKEVDLTLDDVKTSVYYRAGDEVEAAIRGAKLQWTKTSDDEEAAPEGGNGSETPGGTTPVNPDPGTGGGGSGDNGGGDNGGGDGPIGDAE